MLTTQIPMVPTHTALVSRGSSPARPRIPELHCSYRPLGPFTVGCYQKLQGYQRVKKKKSQKKGPTSPRSYFPPPPKVVTASSEEVLIRVQVGGSFLGFFPLVLHLGLSFKLRTYPDVSFVFDLWSRVVIAAIGILTAYLPLQRRRQQISSRDHTAANILDTPCSLY